MQNKNLGSEKLSELEKIRRIISMKKKQLSLLMVELASLRERERELTPLTQELADLEKGDELTPASANA